MILLVLFVSFLTFSDTLAVSCDNLITIRGTWDWGQDGTFNLTVPLATSNWTITVFFDKPITTLNAWDGVETVCSASGGGTTCTFKNQVKNFKKHLDIKTNPVIAITILS
jgi:hypothetical protein